MRICVLSLVRKNSEIIKFLSGIIKAENLFFPLMFIVNDFLRSIRPLIKCIVTTLTQEVFMLITLFATPALIAPDLCLVKSIFPDLPITDGARLECQEDGAVAVSNLSMETQKYRPFWILSVSQTIFDGSGSRTLVNKLSKTK